MERLDFSEIEAINVRVRFRRINLHCHNYHEFFYCYSGSGEQLVEKGIESMGPEDLFFFPAESNHRGSGARNEDCIGAVVNFGDDLFSNHKHEEADFVRILNMMKRWSLEKTFLIPLTKSGAVQCGKIIRQMTKESTVRSLGYYGALKQLSMQLLLIIARNNRFPSSYMKELQYTRDDKIAIACSYIDNNFDRKITVDAVCKVINLSRSHFHAEFLKETGVTMTQYINKKRCEAAIEQIKHEHMTTEAVARKCGFGSLCSFYRVLREETGMTPSSLKT